MSKAASSKTPRVIFGLAMVVGLFWVARREGPQPRLTEITGQTMGTVPYSIKAISTDQLDIKWGVDSLLTEFNKSLSTYIADSEISRFNRNDTLAFESSLFLPVLQASRDVVDATDGAFDPTVGPLVNAWGFGPEGVTYQPDSMEVDSLRAFVNFGKIQFNSQFVTKRPNMYLDFSAIAKGYAVDLVAIYLESLEVDRYMVEIGGEVRTRGTNMQEELWRLGIEDPLVAKNERKLLAIVNMDNRSLATSGNYRNYYEKDGQTFAHIIDPRTGYNNFNSILSASVFSPECMLADAYATAFMVMGVDKSIALIERDPKLEAILVYRDGDDVKTYQSTGIRRYVTMDRTAEPTEQ
ncbi:MAG: FAD:protein FMN transferase [Bacteroidota bacterium]